MILNVVNRLVEARAVISLQVRMTIGEPRNRTAFDDRRLVVGQVLALPERQRGREPESDNKNRSDEIHLHLTYSPSRRLPDTRGTHIPTGGNFSPCGAPAAWRFSTVR